MVNETVTEKIYIYKKKKKEEEQGHTMNDQNAAVWVKKWEEKGKQGRNDLSVHEKNLFAVTCSFPLFTVLQLKQLK